MTSTLEIEILNFLKFLYWKLWVLDENVGYFSYKITTEQHLASHQLCKSHPMTFKKKKKQTGFVTRIPGGVRPPSNKYLATCELSLLLNCLKLSQPPSFILHPI